MITGKRNGRSQKFLRFSQESKLAYDDLKRILKYHIFGRGGGIINKIKTESGDIITNPQLINEQLAQTIEEIQIDNRWEFLEEKEFPKLPQLTEKEVRHLMKNLSTNKAITLDGVSDIMFSKEYRKSASKIFRDLWSIDLGLIKGIMCSLTSRLNPLNKVFPDIPERTEMRPIVIGSPVQKLLESRFLPKLNDYLVNKLTPSQTGFIPRMGIQVNLVRALYWIKENMKDTARFTYGLFIDFANAYNSVPHQLLFEKLRKKNCLEDIEIDYLQALYSRYRIRIGNRIIKFNKGVAQGSIISPALFNIFIEDLVEKLSQELKMSIEDILFYADDLLLLCKTPDQVERCVQIIEQWSHENGMKLNRKKSGLVVFAPRSAKKIPYMELKTELDEKGKIKSKEWTSTINELFRIPIVSKYKYIATFLDCKLTMKTQLEYIRRKSDSLFVKLYPYLSNATAGGRKDMWRTMVVPLFNALLALTYFEGAETNNKNLIRLWHYTFKRFMLIPKSTKTELIDEMIGIDINELNILNAQNSARKWYARYTRTEPNLLLREKPTDYLRGIPKDWCDILKQQCSLCPICRNSTKNAKHMEEQHEIEILSYRDIWDSIKATHLRETEKLKKNKPGIMKVKREVFLKIWKPKLEKIKEIIEIKMKQLYIQH